MDVFHNLDLLALAVVVSATAVLGYAAYASNRKSATNRLFFAFAVVTAAWGTVNYFSYQFADPGITLMLLRGIMFFATMQAFTLYCLFRVFPGESETFKPIERLLLFPAFAGIALMTLTPAVFRSIIGSYAQGEVAVVEQGSGIIVFGIFAVGLVVAAVYLLYRKARAASGEMRRGYGLIFAGIATTFTLIISLNFLAATVFGRPDVIRFGGLFMFPLVASIAYAILRHRLFNVKVAAAALLVCIIAVVSFLEIIFSQDYVTVIFRTSTFTLIILSGMLLIRGVVREVEQKELIQAQEKELEIANQQQESLLHFISHEVKGYLTKSAATFAGISDGDFGPVTAPVKDISDKALTDVRKGVDTVMEILSASDLKKGTVSYKQSAFNLLDALTAVVEQLRPAAVAKGLTLNFSTESSRAYMVKGDKDKLQEHVLRNIIDNSIKYTPKGSVSVSLTNAGSGARITIADTGVGITPDDMARLFTEGGHGKNSIKVNVDSTGYGLFIAKQIVDAHRGRIWAESDGAGKGSRFVIELPAAG